MYNSNRHSRSWMRGPIKYRVRTMITICASVLTLLICLLSFNKLGQYLDVLSYIAINPDDFLFEGPMDEDSTSATLYGIFSSCLSIMITYFVGCFVNDFKWWHKITNNERYLVLSFLVGSFLLTVFSILVDLAFRSFQSKFADSLFVIIQLGGSLAIGGSIYQWYMGKINIAELRK